MKDITVKKKYVKPEVQAIHTMCREDCLQVVGSNYNYGVNEELIDDEYEEVDEGW